MVNPSSPYGKFFIQGNIFEGNATSSADNWKGGVKANDLDSVRALTPFEVELISEQSAKDAFDAVVKHAGTSLSRDDVDKRIVKEVCSGTASFGKNKNGIIDSQNDVGSWPLLASVTAQEDTDGDGMPDTWEKNHELNRQDPSDGTMKPANGDYTNLEVYLNEIVKDIIR